MSTVRSIAGIGVGLIARLAATAGKSTVKQGEVRKVPEGKHDDPPPVARPRYELADAGDGSTICIDNSNNRQVEGSLCRTSDELWYT